MAEVDADRLDLDVLAVAAAAAVGLDTIAAATSCGHVDAPLAQELRASLTEEVVRVSASGRRSGDGFHHLAEAALWADARLAVSGTDGSVGRLARDLLGSNVFDWWRTALFDVARERPELAGELAGIWSTLATEVVAALSHGPAPTTEVEQAQQAAVIPLSTLDGRIDPHLGGLLPEWLQLAAGNPLAFDQWARWVLMSGVSGSEILDSLDVLLVPDQPIPSDLSTPHELFAHMLTQPLGPEDRARAYQRLDQLVAAGYDQLRALLPEM